MSVAAVLFEGTGAAVVGGALAAVVALKVLARQIDADRRAQGRAEDVRVAVMLQAAAGQLNFALLSYKRLTRRGRDRVEDCLLVLWRALAEAQARRPGDEATRDWARRLGGDLVTGLDRYVTLRPPYDVEVLTRWISEHCQALASHLENGKPLPQIRALLPGSRRPR